MTAIISTQNLGKAYTLSHLGSGQKSAGYSRLSEDLLKLPRMLMERLLSKPNSAIQTEPFWALQNVNLEIEPGEVVGIIGRNGAGKSTLLKILSRITEPTEGRVTIRGRVASLWKWGLDFTRN